jgi:hypothetical protein
MQSGLELALGEPGTSWKPWQCENRRKFVFFAQHIESATIFFSARIAARDPVRDAVHRRVEEIPRIARSRSSCCGAAMSRFTVFAPDRRDSLRRAGTTRPSPNGEGLSCRIDNGTGAWTANDSLSIVALPLVV